MKNDLVQEFHALRSSLLSEREQMQKRLQEIEAALSGDSVANRVHSTKNVVPVASKAPSARVGRPPRSEGGLSIREAITKVTGKEPLGLSDLVAAVQKIGYRFESSNPRNSVGAYLYSKHGKKHFRNVDGKFAPIGSPSAEPASPGKNLPAPAKKAKKK